MSISKLPKINKMQFGVIDAAFINRATSLANSFSDYQPMLSSISAGVTQADFARKPMLVKIISSEKVYEAKIKFYANQDPTSGEEVETEVEVAWKYKWIRVKIKDKSTIVPRDDEEDSSGGHPVIEEIDSDIVGEVLNDEDAGLAYNIAEMGNRATSPVIFGIDMESNVYPIGFRPQPVPDNSYVQLIPHQTEEDSYIFYTFERQGVHDGEACHTEIPPDEFDCPPGTDC